jgi:hypothetical protein
MRNSPLKDAPAKPPHASGDFISKEPIRET